MQLTDEEKLEWIDKMSKTRLFKLAYLKLTRENKIQKNKEFNFLEVLLEGFNVATKAGKKRIKI